MTGFLSPNHTQTPNDLFDIVMRDMGDAELRVVLAIIRQTRGYHRKQVKFSVTKIAEMTGLTRNGVTAGASDAEQHGFIRRLNPDAQGSAEWELIDSDDTPSLSDPLTQLAVPPHSVSSTPSVNGGVYSSLKKGNKDKLNNNFPNGKAAVAPPAPKKKVVINHDHLKRSTPESIKVFQALTKVQRSKGRGEVKYFSNDEQKARLEEATAKLRQAGKFDEALLWALQNERTSRVAMVNALVTWADNLDKPKPEYKNGNGSNGYHKPMTTFERNMAAFAELNKHEEIIDL